MYLLNFIKEFLCTLIFLFHFILEIKFFFFFPTTHRLKNSALVTGYILQFGH